MLGYTANDNLFHADVECLLVSGTVVELPESKALKRGLEYCPDCFDLPETPQHA